MLAFLRGGVSKDGWTSLTSSFQPPAFCCPRSFRCLRLKANPHWALSTTLHVMSELTPVNCPLCQGNRIAAFHTQFSYLLFNLTCNLLPDLKVLPQFTQMLIQSNIELMRWKEKQFLNTLQVCVLEQPLEEHHGPIPSTFVFDIRVLHAWKTLQTT